MNQQEAEFVTLLNLLAAIIGPIGAAFMMMVDNAFDRWTYRPDRSD